MESLTLGPDGRSTSRLGFGCTSIMGGLDERQSLAVLEAAFEVGIRHFDTAPMYGYGRSEHCIGTFLKRHRGETTVTTKFGILPGANGPFLRAARAIARPLLQGLPGLKKRLQGTPAPTAPSKPRTEAAPSAPNPIFNVEQARASLDASLAALKTERIDLWLLHEAKAVDLSNDALLRFLEDAVSAGKIGTFGVGSGREDIPALVAERPAYCRVTQYEWSVLDAAIPEMSYFRIHHRALSEHFHALVELMRSQPEVCTRWSDEVGADLVSTEKLAHLMMKASAVLNPASLLLFSSKRAEHIRANVEAMGDGKLQEPARRLYALLQREQPRFS